MFDKTIGVPSPSPSGFVCEQFVQNAWKRDFCSNCFKSRCEHGSFERKPQASGDAALVTKSVLVCDSGRMTRTTPSKSPAKRNVSFNEHLVEVIGIGGDDFDGDDYNFDDDDSDDDDCDGSSHASIDDVIDNDDGADLSLVKITRINTDMNAGRKDILSLGVTQTLTNDRKPLEIQIRPFGDDSCLPTAKSLEPEQEPERHQHSPDHKKKTVSLNRNCAFVREKPMIYQAKNFKINYLTKSKKTLPPQLPPTACSTPLAPVPVPPAVTKTETAKIVATEDRSDEMIEILSTTSSIDNEYAIDDCKEEPNKVPHADKEVPVPKPDQKSRAALLIDQKSLTIPIPSKRKAPNPPSAIESFDETPTATSRAASGQSPGVDKKLGQSKTFGKVFLKRFLKIGKQNDEADSSGSVPDLLEATEEDDNEREDGNGNGSKPKPKPKPRLHIVHPFELNGLDVKVIKNIKESREEVPSPPPRKPQRHLRQHKKSSESVESTSEQVVAAVSRPDEPAQGGSESESELYAQYSFCSSENETSGFVDDDDDADESAIPNNLNLTRIDQQLHLMDSSENCLQISIQAALVDKKSVRLATESGSSKRKAPNTPPPPIPSQQQQQDQPSSSSSSSIASAKQVEDCDRKPISVPISAPVPKPKQKPKPKLTIVHPFKLSGINVQVVINIEKNREVPSPLPRKPHKVSRQQKPNETSPGSGAAQDAAKLGEAAQAASESESELYAQYSFCSSENETSGSIDDDDDDEEDDNDDDDENVPGSGSGKTDAKYDSKITLDPINHQSNIYIMDNKCFVAYANAEPAPSNTHRNKNDN